MTQTFHCRHVIQSYPRKTACVHVSEILTTVSLTCLEAAARSLASSAHTAQVRQREAQSPAAIDAVTAHSMVGSTLLEYYGRVP